MCKAVLDDIESNYDFLITYSALNFILASMLDIYLANQFVKNMQE